MQENKKFRLRAFPIIITIILFAFFIGFGLGIFFTMLQSSPLESSDNIDAISSYDYISIAYEQWGLALMAIILPIYYIYSYHLLKTSLTKPSQKDVFDRHMSVLTFISNAALYISILLLTVCASSSHDSLTNQSPAILLYFITTLECILINHFALDLYKQLHPNQKASIYDFRFGKSWAEGCDDNEKLSLYKTAYSANTMTNTLCLIMMALLLIATQIVDIGFLPSLVVCVILVGNLFVATILGKK